MSGLLGQAIGLFVDPPAARAGEAPSAWAPPVPNATVMPAAATEPTSGPEPARPASLGAPVAVVGSSADAVILAAALANELRLRCRSRTALLLVWCPLTTDASATPARPSARRLAARLSAGDRPAVPRGHLVRVGLPMEPAAAAADASRLLAGETPAVLVLAGPRAAAFDSALGSASLVVVAADPEAPPTLSTLAAEQLKAVNPEVLVVPALGGAVARIVANAGLGRLRRVGGALVTGTEP